MPAPAFFEGTSRYFVQLLGDPFANNGLSLLVGNAEMSGPDGEIRFKVLEPPPIDLA